MSINDLINSSYNRSEESDFDKIVAENYRSVYGLALRLTGSVCDSEDITQEVFMKFYRSQSSFRGDSKVSTLLYRITYNHTIDFLRRKKTKPSQLNEDIALQSPDSTDERERYELLHQAIVKLPIKERALITLFYMEDKSIEEISKIATISIANVKVQLHRIRKKLYTIIGEKFYE